MRWMRAAVSTAALIALVAVVGTLAYVSARDDPASPATTTSTAPPDPEELAAAVAEALSTGLDAPLPDTEARCLAEGILVLLGPDRLTAMAEAGGDLGDLREDDRDGLVRLVVGCVPEATAAALLGSASTTTTVAQLPDEGTSGR